MKVYELMNLLKNLPSGMSVRAMAPGVGAVGEITDHEVDGHDADGLLSLVFEPVLEYQTEEKP